MNILAVKCLDLILERILKKYGIALYSNDQDAY